MKIQNYDVNVELARKALDCVPFALDVISVCKPFSFERETPIPPSKSGKKPSLPIEPIWKLYTHSYDDVANMLHQIPIYLTKADKDGKDPLGTYVQGNADISPYIKIYVEEISKEAVDDQKFQWLFTMVLLHEVMHAIMDEKNQISYAGQEADLKREYRKWREESYANGGALWIIREYAKLHPSLGNKEFVKYVENFMAEDQTDVYKLGLKVADFPVRYMRHWIDEKMGKNSLNAEKKEWKSLLSDEDKTKLNIK